VTDTKYEACEEKHMKNMSTRERWRFDPFDSDELLTRYDQQSVGLVDMPAQSVLHLN
jgi:ABC-type uncharacterized transport system substrate-binding protein